MLEQAWEIGVKEGLGIFFFLFLMIMAFLGYVVRWVFKTNYEREQKYVKTIEEMAEAVNKVSGLDEMRRENRDGHSDTQKMVARILDRLPPLKNGNGTGSYSK